METYRKQQPRDPATGNADGSRWGPPGVTGCTGGLRVCIAGSAVPRSPRPAAPALLPRGFAHAPLRSHLQHGLLLQSCPHHNSSAVHPARTQRPHTNLEKAAAAICNMLQLAQKHPINSFQVKHVAGQRPWRAGWIRLGWRPRRPGEGSNAPQRHPARLATAGEPYRDRGAGGVSPIARRG